MQHFDETAFRALPPAKAKAAALALFDSAMIQPVADWRGVAFALHSIIAKPKAAAPAIDDGFAPWADYEPGRKSARGTMTVAFADGWSCNVNAGADRTARGLKPWSIARAVRFAVVRWRLAACRRLTGSDAALFHVYSGGLEKSLDTLIACPEIASVVTADGQDTTAGALVWNPETVNRETLHYRAGKVSADAPDFADALARERVAMIGVLIPLELAMQRRVRVIAERVGAALFPDDPAERTWYAGREFTDIVRNDPDGYPMDAETQARHDADVAERAKWEAEAEAERARCDALPVIDYAEWTINGACMSEAFPHHVVVATKGKRARLPNAAPLAKVRDLTLDRTLHMSVMPIADALALLSWRGGFEVKGPRVLLKRYRQAVVAKTLADDAKLAEHTERQAAMQEADALLDREIEAPCWAMGLGGRRQMITDALMAWPPIAEQEAPPAKPRYVFRDGSWAMKEAA